MTWKAELAEALGLAGMSPDAAPEVGRVEPSLDAHFRRLGGHEGVWRATGDLAIAHQLWDSWRLWRRDRSTERATRWEKQYWHYAARVDGRLGPGARLMKEQDE